MKIKYKLLISYSLIVITALLVSYFVFSLESTIDSSFSNFSEKTVPAILLLEEIKFAGLRIVSSSHEYHVLIIHKIADDAQLVKQETSFIEEGIQTYVKKLNEYKKYINIPHKRKYYAEITYTGYNLIELARNFVSTQIDLKNSTELVKLKEVFEQAEGDFLEACNLAIQHEINEAGQRKESFDILKLVSVVIFLISITIGIRVSFSISN